MANGSGTVDPFSRWALGIIGSLLAAGVVGAVVTYGAVRELASDVSNIRHYITNLESSVEKLEGKVDGNADSISKLPKESPPAWLRADLTEIKAEQKAQARRIEDLSAEVRAIKGQ